jgi:hypothetical protein
MASGESQAGFVFSKLSRDSGENKNMVEGHRIEQKFLHRLNRCNLSFSPKIHTGIYLSQAKLPE